MEELREILERWIVVRRCWSQSEAAPGARELDGTAGRRPVMGMKCFQGDRLFDFQRSSGLRREAAEE